MVGDYTGLTLTWQQDGPAAAWTVYCDPLDGSETDCALVTQPTHRFADLAPGTHHVGVVAWNSGRFSPGEGCWGYAEVLDYPSDRVRIPVLTDVMTEGDAVVAAWISSDATTWQARLLRDRETVHDLQVENEPTIRFGGLLPKTRYGVQIRALGTDLTASPWCDVVWTRTATTADVTIT